MRAHEHRKEPGGIAPFMCGGIDRGFDGECESIGSGVAMKTGSIAKNLMATMRFSLT
jgi:hypothetical protein